jgi:hypothetical protein
MLLMGVGACASIALALCRNDPLRQLGARCDSPKTARNGASLRPGLSLWGVTSSPKLGMPKRLAITPEREPFPAALRER